jgi:hypothetical protein
MQSLKSQMMTLITQNTQKEVRVKVRCDLFALSRLFQFIFFEKKWLNV